MAKSSAKSYAVRKDGDRWCVYDGAGKKIADFQTEAEARAHDEKMRMREREMALEHANAIRGVEIFATGTHNGDHYTEQDLDDMVEAFNALDVRPALKVGHTKDKIGGPAYGWITNLKRAGSKLVADFESMHDSVIEAIRKRAYDRVSSEIYFNLERGGKKFRRALKAVALLGAEVPAVAGLTPLHKLEFELEQGFDSLAQCEQSLDVSADALVAALSARVDGLINLVKEYDMSKNTEKIASLEAKVATFEQQVAELKKAGKKEDDAEVKKLAADAASLRTEIADLKKADDTDAENEALKKRIAALEAEGRERALKEKLASVTVPAFRPLVRGLFEHAIAHPEAIVKAYATKDGKETATDVSMLAQVDGLVAEINRQVEHLFKSLASAGVTPRTEGDDTEGRPDEQMDRKVKEYQAQHKDVSYEDAMVAVSKANPELARAYGTERGSAN